MQGLSTRFARAEALAEAQGTPLGCCRNVMGRTRTVRGMTQRSSPALTYNVWFRFAHGLGLQPAGSAAPDVTGKSEPPNQPLTALKRSLRAVARNPNRNKPTGTAPTVGQTNPTAVPRGRSASQPWRHSEPRSAA